MFVRTHYFHDLCVAIILFVSFVYNFVYHFQDFLPGHFVRPIQAKKIVLKGTVLIHGPCPDYATGMHRKNPVLNQ